MADPAQAYVLIVEDDPALQRSLESFVRALAPVVTVSTADDARERLDSQDEIIAVLLDVALPDGNGLDLLLEIRPRRPLLPVLVMTGREAWDDVNQAFALSARYVRKTSDPSALARMVSSFVITSLPDAARALRLIDEFAERFELSDRQRELVRLYIQGCPRDGLGQAMRVSENTVKTHIRETLRKCETSSLDALCRQILQEALAAGPSAPEPQGPRPDRPPASEDDEEE